MVHSKEKITFFFHCVFTECAFISLPLKVFKSKVCEQKNRLACPYKIDSKKEQILIGLWNY